MNLQEKLAAFGEVKTQESLRKHTTYKIGGDADYFLIPSSIENLIDAVQFLKLENIPCFVLGRGSNVLIADRPYRGVVISMVQSFTDYDFEEETGILSAQAGCSLINLSIQAMQRSLSGLEFASGIPGSVGGGLFMNAGAYNSALSEILIDVLVLKDGEAVVMKPEELHYTYRHSDFQKHRDWIILSARFQLSPKPKEEIKALMDSRKERRQSSQPYDKPCAGSVFRNPAGEMGAWQIIDSLGYRGQSRGHAKVSEKHSNFIVNEDGQALASDVAALIEEIQQKAKEKYGVELVTEVERINWE